MQFNSKGKLAKFYMWLPPNDKRLPTDFCTYFWGLVGRALFIFGVGGMFLVMLVSSLVVLVIWFSKLVWANKGVSLFVFGWLVFMALVIYLSDRKKKIKIGIITEISAVIKGKVDSVKKRYCPRIDLK
jgi:hypothetical protein